MVRTAAGIGDAKIAARLVVSDDAFMRSFPVPLVNSLLALADPELNPCVRLSVDKSVPYRPVSVALRKLPELFTFAKKDARYTLNTLSHNKSLLRDCPSLKYCVTGKLKMLV